MELQTFLAEDFNLKFLKWVEIILQEDMAVKLDAMYILVKDQQYCDVIFVDGKGIKRKIQNISKESLILDFPLKDLSNLNEEDIDKWKYILGSLSATISVGETISLDPGENPIVINVGTSKDAIFDFGIPKGDTGLSATINIGQVVTVNPEEEANVINVGTENNAVFNFEIPKGEKGDDGEFILEYNDTGETIASDITTKADINNGVIVNYRDTETWYNGSPMDISKVDGIVYRESQNGFEKLEFSEGLDIGLWGVKGDGITNDSTAFKKAIDFCILTGNKLTSRSGKTYIISSDIVIDTLGSQGGALLDFNGSTIKLNNANIKVTHNNNTAYLTTSLTADLKRGDTFISLLSVSGIEIGDLIEVESPAITTNNINVSQYYVVNDLDGNNVYIDGYIVNDVNPQQIIDDGKTGSIVVRLRKTGKGLVIRNFKLIGDRNKEQTSLIIQNQHNCTIENYEVINSTREGVYMLYNGLTRHFNGNFKVFGYVRYDQGYNSVPSSPGGLSFGYGLIHARNAISFVDNCEGSYGWHAFDAARGETFITYSNCRGFKNAFTFSTHEGAWDVRYNNPDVFGGHGITTRTVFMTVNGGTLRTNFGHGIAGLGASETSIQGVTIDNVYGGVNKGAALYTPGLIVYGAGSKSEGRNQKAIIRNNILINQSQEVSASAEELIFENNVVKNVEGFYTSLNIKGSKKLYCRFNNLYDIINASAITFQVYNNQLAIFENNKIFGNFQTTAGAAMFASNGSVTADTTDIQLINNSCSPAVALVRNLTANSNIRFTKIERNTNYLRLFLSDIGFKMVDVYNNIGNQPISVSGGTLLPTGNVFGNQSTNILRFGTIGSRQNNAIYLSQGQNYYSTNTNMLSLWDGSSWRDAVGLASATNQGTVLKSVAVTDVTATNSSAVSIADLTAIETADATDPTTTQALVNELKAKLNLAIILINDTKSKYNSNVTLSNSNKAQLNAKLLADRNSGQQS